MKRRINSATAILLLALCQITPPAPARDLSPQEIFRHVAPSVVVIEVREQIDDHRPRLAASGSGVVVPGGNKWGNRVVTNCHLFDGFDGLDTLGESGGSEIRIIQGDKAGFALLVQQDRELDICVVHAIVPGTLPNGEPDFTNNLVLAPAQVSSSTTLDIGDSVYAVGAPQGLEMSLSNGLVSGFREYKGNKYIQTTAPISRGSSGGGLFDAQGRLVGITTLYHRDGQALNFAVPAELIASAPKTRYREKPQGRVTAAQEAADSAAAAAAATAEAAQAAVDAAVEAADPMPSGRGEYRRPKDRWWTFYKDVEREVAFDLETVSRSGPSVTVWERTRYAKPRRSTSGMAYVEDVSRSTYYCGSRKYSYDQFTWRGANGEVIHNQILKSWEIERQAVMPETIGETIYEAACNP